MHGANDILGIGTVSVPAHREHVLDHSTHVVDGVPGPAANVELRYGDIVPGQTTFGTSAATCVPQSDATNLALHFDGTSVAGDSRPNPSAYRSLCRRHVVALSLPDACGRSAWTAILAAPWEGPRGMRWDGTN